MLVGLIGVAGVLVGIELIIVAVVEEHLHLAKRLPHVCTVTCVGELFVLLLLPFCELEP